MANPPFVPTATYKVQTMIELTDPKPGQSMIDLGSGDGRIPIAFAERGVLATGIEHNPELVRKARLKIADQNLQTLVTIKETDFWETTIVSFDIIVIFGMQSIMNRLEYKIGNEANKGALVVSNVFQFQRLKLLKTKDDVYMYLVR